MQYLETGQKRRNWDWNFLAPIIFKVERSLSKSNIIFSPRSVPILEVKNTKKEEKYVPHFIRIISNLNFRQATNEGNQGT